MNPIIRTRKEEVEDLVSLCSDYRRTSLYFEEKVIEKDRLIASLHRIIDKQRQNIDKADSWHQYFMENPDKVFTGAEIVAVMRQTHLIRINVYSLQSRFNLQHIMTLLFLIKYRLLHLVFDCYKDRAIGKKNWYARNIHAKVEKYLTLNADTYCNIVNS